MTGSWNAGQRPTDWPAAAGDPRQPWPPGQGWQPPPPGWPADQQQERGGQHARSRRRGPLLLGVALGLVLAVVFGAVLVLSRAMSFGSPKAPAADTRAVALPEELGGLKDIDTVSDGKFAKNSAERHAKHARTYARTQRQYAAAFGGAGAGVRTYADQGLQFFGTVVAVRAPSAGLTVGPDADPADLGLGAPPREIKRFGDLECLLVNFQTVREGQQADPKQQTTTQCRRSSSAFTVDVFGNAIGPAQQKLIVALTEAAFASVSGGG